MTQDDMVKVARECGIGLAYGRESIERFYTFVAAAEREACAKICETGADCEHPTVKGHVMQNFGASTHLAQAIRARGEA